jgi:hypothetical protein
LDGCKASICRDVEIVLIVEALSFPPYNLSAEIPRPMVESAVAQKNSPYFLMAFG